MDQLFNDLPLEMQTKILAEDEKLLIQAALFGIVISTSVR